MGWECEWSEDNCKVRVTTDDGRMFVADFEEMKIWEEHADNEEEGEVELI